MKDIETPEVFDTKTWYRKCTLSNGGICQYEDHSFIRLRTAIRLLSSACV
jgi:hypothetical protein